MKKLFIALAAVVAFCASATTIEVGAGRMGVASTPGKTTQDNTFVAVRQATAYGTLDGALTYGNTDGAQGNTNGYEVGYSYPVSLKKFTVIPRVFVGNTTELGTEGHFYGTSVEWRLPLTAKLGGFANVDYRKGSVEATGSLRKTYSFGVDYPVSKAVSIRASYRHANLGGNELQNGVQGVVSYSF